jgi:hypothetical protein
LCDIPCSSRKPGRPGSVSPLWETEPSDADVDFRKVLRGSPSGIRLARLQALTTYFLFVELWHKVWIHR